MNTSKTYIWTIPTRIFHWMLVVSLVGAYIAEEDFITTHVAFGYSAGALIIFRLLWGIVGPMHSRFSDFPMGIGSLRKFASSFTGHSKPYAGHNPAASWVMLAIIIDALLLVCSGLLTLAQEGQQGLFANLPLAAGIEFKELHEVFFQSMVVLVIAHLAGLVVDFIWHKSQSALTSMFTGYKNGVDGHDVKLNGFQKLLAFFGVAVPLAAFLTILSGPPVLLNEKGEGEKTETPGNQGESEGDEDEDDD